MMSAVAVPGQSGRPDFLLTRLNESQAAFSVNRLRHHRDAREHWLQLVDVSAGTKTPFVSARSSIKQRGRGQWQRHKDAQKESAAELCSSPPPVCDGGERLNAKSRKRRGWKSLWMWFTRGFITVAGFWREETAEDKAEPRLCCFPFY